MNEHAGVTASIWMHPIEMPRYDLLKSDTSADVVVVGGGIAGLTTAYMLARRGQSVVLVDDGPLCGGETERTSAHLVNALDHRYEDLERLHGKAGAKAAAQSHTGAIQAIEEIIGEEGIACEFVRLDGWLFAPAGEPSRVIDREFDAAQRAGLHAVERHERVPGVAFETGACVRFPKQARFHPIKYLRGLAIAAERHGVRVYTGTRAAKIEGGTSATVTTSDGVVITAKAVVVATNTPVNDRVTIHTKQAAYRTYAVGMEVPKGSVPDMLLWDTEDPFHYVRLQEDVGADLLIVGGEDHKTGQADDMQARYERLEAWARARFPVTTTRYHWSGQVMESSDGLAFIGHNPGDKENVYICTGDSGNGLTHGTIAGQLIADLILGAENPYTKLYSPSRLPAASEFAKENANVAAQYADWIKPGDVSDVEQVQPGEGAVVRRGLKMVAVYCDEDGGRHECSAVCPHLGAVVRWNPGEKTWDCPAHGSRFTARGEPINGPAIGGLKQKD